MKAAISKENTTLRAELKLFRIVGPKIWPTSATKNMKKGVIWLLFSVSVCKAFHYQ